MATINITTYLEDNQDTRVLYYKGNSLRLPRLTTTQRDLLVPQTGDLVDNITTNQIERYDGAAWSAIGSVGSVDTFQTVTTAGNSTTNNVQLNGSQLVFSNFFANALLKCNPSNSNLQLGSNGSSFWANLDMSGITNDRTYAFPNNSGTFALTSDIPSTANNVIQNGNSFGATMRIGTNDAFDFRIETSNTPRLTVNGTTGNVMIEGAGGANSDSYRLQLRGQGASSQFQQGEIFVDGNGTSNHSLNLGLTLDSTDAQLQLYNQELVLAGTNFQRIRRAIGNLELVSANALNTCATSGNLVFSTVNTSTPRMSISNAGVVTINNLSGATNRLVQVDSSGVLTATTDPSTLITSTTGIVRNGNSFGATMIIGTNDNNALSLETNGTNKLTIATNGTVSVDTANYETLVVSNNNIPNKKYVDDGLALKANTTHVHDASAITTGTIATARLGTGSVGSGAKVLADNQSFVDLPTVGGVVPLPYISTRYYTLVTEFGQTTTSSFGAGRVYYHVWYIRETITIDSFQFRATAGTAANVRYGVYNSNINQEPTTLLYDLGTIALTGTNSTITQTVTPFTLNKGLYFLATHGNASGSMFFFETSLPALYYQTNGPELAVTMYEEVRPYASGLPATASGFTGVSRAYPCISFRKQ